MTRTWCWIALAAVACAAPSVDTDTEPLTAGGHLVGAAKVDITGPFVGASTGYNSPGDQMHGLAMRLFARTFVVEDGDGRVVALVTADMLHLDQGISMSVVQRLAEHGHGARFGTDNVLLAATHTHAATSNVSWYTLFNLFNGVVGFDALHHEIVVSGIAASIEAADAARQPATLSLAQGDVPDAATNRSRPAYDVNRDAGDFADIDPTMTLLRFDAASGAPIGALTWFGVHGTSLGIDNRRVHGDNKGFAAYEMERRQLGNGFVAAFAQGTVGDASPNQADPADRTASFRRPSDLDPALDPLEDPIVHGRRQLAAALSLYDGARPLAGPIDVRHTHVAFNETPVGGRYLENAMPSDREPARASTCVGAVGAGFLAGDEEGAPVDFADEGDLRNPVPAAGLAPCHAEKLVLLPVGDVRAFWPFNPDVPWVPVHLPLQVVRIGSLAVAAAPFEVTTMAGRRIEARVGDTLRAAGIDTVVVASMANAYGQYLTTREEYSAQHFEGAFTLFGPWAAAATTQELDRLADDLVAGQPSAPGETPPDLSDQQHVETPASALPPPLDTPGWGRHFGQVLADAEPTYRAARDRVTVRFQGANPRLVQELSAASALAPYVATPGHTYLEVQRESADGWVTIATDGDPYTAIDWEDRGGVVEKRSAITLTWLVRDGAPGRHRVIYHGIANTRRGPQAFTGTSRTFELR